MEPEVHRFNDLICNSGDRRGSRLKLRKQSDVLGGGEHFHFHSAHGATFNQLRQIYSAHLP